MIELQREERLESPGKWKGGTTKGRKTALITCPRCGAIFSISRHEIAPSMGKVFPSVVCPFRCGFHDHVRLEGWDGGHSDPRKG